jgi:hypothetical protein
VVAQNFAKSFGAHIRHVERARTPIALDQSHDRVHMARAATHLGARLAADKGQIRLNGLALSTHRRRVCGTLHNLANAMHQKPRGFHAAIEGPLNLPGADSLLAGVNELDRLQP